MHDFINFVTEYVYFRMFHEGREIGRTHAACKTVTLMQDSFSVTLKLTVYIVYRESFVYFHLV